MRLEVALVGRSEVEMRRLEVAEVESSELVKVRREHVDRVGREHVDREVGGGGGCESAGGQGELTGPYGWGRRCGAAKRGECAGGRGSSGSAGLEWQIGILVACGSEGFDWQ